uniref:ENSMUSG00000052629 protein n=1 Tax=Mus musculus TaxID=10090 RepID=Q91VZ9_MOUSE|nr:ENSMUSG00000052629 protein [Mus musculus]
MLPSLSEGLGLTDSDGNQERTGTRARQPGTPAADVQT